MKDKFKYYIRAGLLPVLITSGPLWIAVDHMWAGIFTPVTQVIFYCSLLLFVSQFVRIVAIMFGDLIFGVDLNECLVDKLLQQGNVLLAKMKKSLHTKLLAEYVVGTLLKEKRKKHRKLSRLILLNVLLEESGHLLDSPALTRCALNYLGARVVISYCFSASIKLLIGLEAEVVHHQPVLVGKYVVLFAAYGFALLFSRSVLRYYGFRYARKFWELFRNSDKSTKTLPEENSRLN